MSHWGPRSLLYIDYSENKSISSVNTFSKLLQIYNSVKKKQDRFRPGVAELVLRISMLKSYIFGHLLKLFILFYLISFYFIQFFLFYLISFFYLILFYHIFIFFCITQFNSRVWHSSAQSSLICLFELVDCLKATDSDADTHANNSLPVVT